MLLVHALVASRVPGLSLRACRSHASARVGGGSVPQAHRARLISAWTAETRGRSMKVRPRNLDGPRPALLPRAERPSTRAVSHRPNPPPTLSQAPAWRGYKYRGVVFLEGVWHRRAIEARRCPRGMSTSGETWTAEHRPTRHRPLHDRRAVVAFGAHDAPARQAPSHPRPKRACQRAAEGARPRQTHKGAPARQGAVRVMGGGTRCGRPRASSRPRWPDDAKNLPKILVALSPRQSAEWVGGDGRPNLRRELPEGQGGR